MTDVAEHRAHQDSWIAEADAFNADPAGYAQALLADPARAAQVADVCRRSTAATLALRAQVDRTMLHNAALRLENERLQDELDALRLARDVAVAALASTNGTCGADGCVVCVEQDTAGLVVE
jgi:hypothetical protein